MCGTARLIVVRVGSRHLQMFRLCAPQGAAGGKEAAGSDAVGQQESTTMA